MHAVMPESTKENIRPRNFIIIKPLHKWKSTQFILAHCTILSSEIYAILQLKIQNFNNPLNQVSIDFILPSSNNSG